MSNYWQKKMDELNEQQKKKKKKEEDIAPVATSNSSTSNSSDDYWGSKLNELKEDNKKKTISTIGIETFDDDMKNVASTVNTIYSGWQDADTMKAGKSSVQSMYNRLKALQDYNTNYGDGSADYTETITAYKSVLDEWDSLDRTYRQFATADEYNKAYNQSKESKESEENQAKLKDLESKYNRAIELSQAVAKARSNSQRKKGAGREAITTAQKAYNDYMKSIGYEDLNTLKADVSALKGDNRTWFQKGAYEDGYQAGDFLKTAKATETDIKENLGTAILGMGEKVVDFFASSKSQIMRNAQMEATEEHLKNLVRKKASGESASGGAYKSKSGSFGSKSYDELYQEKLAEKEKAASEFVAKDLYDEEKIAKLIISDPVKKMYGVDAETDSILGEKSDALVQSAGQLGVTAALQAVHVPWWLTTGVTSYGSEMENALNQGATLDEANLSAAISAGAEILTEKISGGIKFGGKTFDDALTKGLAKGISNKVVRTLTKLGVDMLGEGGEEVLSGVMSALGQKLTYANDKEMSELFSSEEVFESLIGGMVLGGGGSAVNIVKSNAKGVDAVTGLTDNEQKVFDKVYKDAIAEQETDGKKLTQREKSKLYDSILNDLEKGYITTDQIESILGGETYKAYQDAISNEEALQTEFDELNKMKQGDMTGEQIDRRTELKEQLAELKNNSNKDSLKTKLSEEVFGLVNGSRLAESYLEDSRRGTAFEADLSQYDEKQAEVVKKAVESRILNNTNRTHEFVDMIAKISADKGVLFDFTNNTKLKDSGFAVDGKFVNGYITKDGVTLNIDSSKSLNSVVGHEITHVLEGTELYQALQQTITDYAKAKGDYQGRYDNIAKLYEGVENADVDAELTADLVGDYLFTDGEFIRNLSTKNRNLFQKIYDEIKYLYKVATAGSKEARELEKVKKAFEDAYRAEGKGNTKTSYSLTEVEAVQPKSDKWHRTLTTEEAKARFPKLWDVAAEESEVRNPTQIASTTNTYRKIFDYLKKEGFNGTILDASSGLGYGTKAGIEEYGFNIEDIEPYPDKNYNPKYTDYSQLDKKYDAIISSFVLNVLPQDQRDALVVKMGELLNDGGRIFVNTRSNDVESLAKTGKNIHLGDMEWIETTRGSYQKGFRKAELVAYLQDALGDGFTVEPTSLQSAVAAIVTKKGTAKYSLSDSDGNQLSKEQQDFFKDSKVRDENGNLKVMYHGSQDAGFHIFDSMFSDDDTSFFFVDRNDVAQTYSGSSEVYTARTFRNAEDFNKFFAEISADEYVVKEENHGGYKWFVLYEDGVEVASAETTKLLYDEFCDYTGLGQGQANYKVYLNLKNPLVVDAEGRNWDNVSRDFSQEIFDRYQTLTADEKAALIDLAEWGDISSFRDELKIAELRVRQGTPAFLDDKYTKNLASAFNKIGGYDANMNDLFTIASDNFAEDTVKEFAVKQMNTRDYAQKAKAEGYDGVIFNNIHDNGGYSNGSEGASTVAIAFDSEQIKSVANEKPTTSPDIRYSLSDSDGKPIDMARVSNNEADTSYSLSYNTEIAQGQRDYLANHKMSISTEELAEAQKVTQAMVDVMMKYSSILPEDKIGKVLTKNGSYDRSVENTTICVRTLAYNEFVDKVQEEIGRPLTQMESFLVSQKLYDIAADPQCLYCYVSLDRKAFNDMLLRYMQDRDSVIAKYNNSDKTPEAVEALYQEFLHGRKDTKQMKSRFDKWIGYVDNGTQLLSLADIATEARQSEIANGKNALLSEQLKDARAYAQSASWSKIQKNYVAYRDEILKLGDKVVKNLNEHYGLRWYSFSDYSPAFIVENMQQITDAAIRGLKGLSYTKDTDFAEIFAPSGMNVNISVFVNQDANGNFFIDEKQSANLEKALDLRRRYPNVGIVATVTNDEALRWAGEQEWTDVIIPFHIVRTGTDVAEYYKWLNYTAESADSVSNSDLWNAYLDSLNLKSENARKKVSKNIYPSEHNNDKVTYLNLCESRGLSPRFARFAGEDWYMKLVNETRLSASESSPLKPSYNLEAAQESFQKFVEKGGYEGGWYKKTIDVNAEAKAVAQDVLAGKKANEVPYGRQDGFVPESLIAGRRMNRNHGKLSLSEQGEAPIKHGNFNVYGRDIALETQEEIAPIQEAPIQEQTTETPEEMFPDSITPTEELDSLIQRRNELENSLMELSESENFSEEEFDRLNNEYKAVQTRISELESEISNTESGRLNSIDDTDAPPEIEAPYIDSDSVTPEDPFDERDIADVGKREVKAYMYENPEVKPFFQDAARGMLGDLNASTKGERIYIAEGLPGSYGAESYGHFDGVSRHTTDDIAELLDVYKYSYAQIKKGLNAIIEDNGAENNAVSKRIEFMLNDRLMKGYRDIDGMDIPADQDYINLLNEKQITEYSEEAFNNFMQNAEQYAPSDDIAPVAENATPVKEAYEAIRPKAEKQPKLIRVDNTDNATPKGKQRKWVGTSTESDVVDGKVLPQDLNQELIHYQPIPNKKTLGNANAKLDNMGYETAVAYIESQFNSSNVSLDDIALGERLIQEAIKKGDTQTAGDLIMEISILGTELGQKVQALSIIKRLTPEGQLRMLERTVERGKTKGDKAFKDVEITQEMIDYILKAYNKDGTYDQADLDGRVEDVKQKIADQMSVGVMDYINEWRYLSMLGNPKTHIRNIVSNIAMKGTVAVKNAIARTVEDIAPIKERTKTWKRASDDVKDFAKQATIEYFKGDTDSKYSESGSIKAKRKIFKTKAGNWLANANSNALSNEDTFFSKPAYRNALSEYLTANGIKTKADIEKNGEIVAKAKQYAMEQAKAATFQQDSYIASKINEIERKNAAYGVVVGSVLPFKKTPINIAKTAAAYSPLGFARNIYDAVQVSKGNMKASEAIDHFAQSITGTSLALIGYALASMGVLNGAGDDDKEGKYDYQLGEQSYSINIGDATISLSWLSPVAMPLFVGANAYEQLVEGEDWNADVVFETLAQTLDPLSEMSFLSSLDDVLSSYDSGIQKFMGIFESVGQNYISQFVPTLSSQVAATFDDTKRSTKASADSGFKFGEETLNQLKYKIPGLRNTLEPSTDIWGNEVKQNENTAVRAFESFLAPYSKRNIIESDIDTEIKAVYSQTGISELIPSIPDNYFNHEGEKYKMSSEEYTKFKQTYGQTAYSIFEDMFAEDAYKKLSADGKADLINKVYDYAREKARSEFLSSRGVKTEDNYNIGDDVSFDGNYANIGDDYYQWYTPENGESYWRKLNESQTTKYLVTKAAGNANYATDGTVHYRRDEDGEWTKISDNDLARQNEVTKALGITPEEYWSKTEKSFIPMSKGEYEYAYENPETYAVAKAVGGYDSFKSYSDDLYNIKADKDENGKSISGSRKEKVLDYVNSLDIDYGEKIILFKSEYNADDTYNAEIVEYLNSRDDISYDEMVTILKKLGFTVTSDGNVYWD